MQVCNQCIININTDRICLLLRVCVCVYLFRHVEIRWRCRHHGEQENLAHAARRAGGHIFAGIHWRWQHGDRKCDSAADSVHLWLDGGHSRPGNYSI